MNGHDPKHAPGLPEGFPVHVLVYDQFRELAGWTPREVDELTLEELEWLPIVMNAKLAARDQLTGDD